MNLCARRAVSTQASSCYSLLIIHEIRAQHSADEHFEPTSLRSSQHHLQTLSLICVGLRQGFSCLTTFLISDLYNIVVPSKLKKSHDHIIWVT